MKKILIAVIVGLILVPQASFAATTPALDRDAQYQAIVQQLIVLLTQQIKVLQARLDTMEAQQKGATITSMPEETIDRVGLTEEAKKIEESIDWSTCRNDKYCVPETRAKLERINEITKLLGSGCVYEITKNNIGKSCGG